MMADHGEKIIFAMQNEREKLSKPMTVEAIRASFPNPVSLGDKIVCGQYSVGGALCQYIGEEHSTLLWPNCCVLKVALCRANPEFRIKFVNRFFAHVYAMAIVNMSEDGNVDQAWAKLEEALAWKDS